MGYKISGYIASRLAKDQKSGGFLNFTRIVAGAGVALGSIALIVSLATLEGFKTHLFDRATQFASHLTITSFNDMILPNAAQTMMRLKKEFPEIVKTYKFVDRDGLIRSNDYVEGVRVRGITSEYFKDKLGETEFSGDRSFVEKNERRIAVGKRLAQKLKVGVGDDIVVMSTKDPARGLSNPRIGKFKIAGIYETGMAQYDDVYVYATFAAAGEFFELNPADATTYEAILSDPKQARRLGGDLERFLGYPYYVLSVFDLHSALFAWIELQEKPIPIVLGLISAVAVMNIITALFISVVEKSRAIGVLRAIGLGKRGVGAIFTVQGLTIGTGGTIAGCALALAFCVLQQNFGLISLKGEIYALDYLPVKISFWHYAVVIGTSVALSYLATTIPARAAMRTSPARIIRFK